VRGGPRNCVTNFLFLSIFNALCMRLKI
jgi:hypothetical protein